MFACVFSMNILIINSTQNSSTFFQVFSVLCLDASGGWWVSSSWRSALRDCSGLCWPTAFWTDGLYSCCTADIPRLALPWWSFSLLNTQLMHYFLVFKVLVKKLKAILIPETLHMDCVFLLPTPLETYKIFFSFFSMFWNFTMISIIICCPGPLDLAFEV